MADGLVYFVLLRIGGIMLRKFFSSCLAILFVPILLTTIIAIGIKLSLLNPNFYLKIFDKSNSYTELIQTIPLNLSQTLQQGDSTTFGPLTQDDLMSSLQESISPTWLKNNLQKILFGVSDYGNGKTYSINEIILLKDVKNTFIESISKKFDNKITDLPTCTKEQAKNMPTENVDPISLSCLPNGTDIEKLKKQFKDELSGGDDSFLKNIPDQYNLSDIVNKNPLLSTNIKTVFGYSNIVLYSLITISTLLLLIITLINMKNISVMLKWISIPLLIVAILTLLTALLGNLSLGVIVNGSTFNLPSAEAKVLLYTIINIAIKQFFIFYYYCSGILMIFSITLLVIAIIISKKQSNSPENNKQTDNKLTS
jgi:hypothetical protein